MYCQKDYKDSGGKVHSLHLELASNRMFIFFSSFHIFIQCRHGKEMNIFQSTIIHDYVYIQLYVCTWIN